MAEDGEKVVPLGEPIDGESFNVVALPRKPTHLDDQLSELSDKQRHGSSKGVLGAAKAFCTEGHTAWDAFLSTASSAVGQVILTLPLQYAYMGLIPAITVQIGVGLLNFYTLWLLIILFLHRKQEMVKADQWYDTEDSHGYRRRSAVTQFHDLIGYSLGPYFGAAAQFLNGLYIFGVAIAQLVASASSQYTIDKRFDKRTWCFILGPVLLAFGYLPNFRSVRLLNIIALAGTNYSCLYFLITAAKHGIVPGTFTKGPVSLQAFYLGAAVVGAGGHSISIEMMDAQRQARKFDIASFTAWVWNIILLLPHSVAIVLAYPTQILKQANVYSVLPHSGFKSVSVYLMLIHNISAFTLHTNPLLYMTEKLMGTHTKSYWIRLPSRTPMLACIFLVSLAIPFYGTVNSLFNAFTTGFIAFILPCLAFNYFYRNQAARDQCPVRIPRLLAVYNWKLLFLFNYFLCIFFLTNSVGFGCWASIKQLQNNIHTFHWFAKCYQCVGST